VVEHTNIHQDPLKCSKIGPRTANSHPNLGNVAPNADKLRLEPENPRKRLIFGDFGVIFGDFLVILVSFLVVFACPEAGRAPKVSKSEAKSALGPPTPTQTSVTLLQMPVNCGSNRKKPVKS